MPVVVAIFQKNMLNKKLKFFIYIIQFIIITTFISYLFIKNDTINKNISRFDFKIVYNKTVLYLSPNAVKRSRIFCFILTSSKNFLGPKTKVIYKTWANKCDNYKFITVVPDEVKAKNTSLLKSDANGTEYNYGFDILQPPGLINDTYNKLTDKVYLTLKHLYNKYNDYDW